MEKNIIFYFTGTGNSLKIAKDIAKGLESCEVTLITKFEEKILDGGYSRVGFIYPVYCGNIPLAFSKFLENTYFDRNKDAFFFGIANGGGNCGHANFVANELLEKQGLKLNFTTEVKMVGNYVALYDMPKEFGDVNKKVATQIEEIISNIVEKKASDTKLKQNKLYKIVTDGFMKKFPTMDKNFNVNSDCTGCTTCAKVCPVQNIEMKENRPEYLHKCEQCMACIQLCPTKAINYKTKTVK